MKKLSKIALVLLTSLSLLTTACMSDGSNSQTSVLTYQNEVEGLEMEDLTVGEGTVAEKGDKVSVHYTGTFEDGSKFDSSLDRGTPFDFVLGGGMVIQGWDEGVEGMQIGGKRSLVIQPELGYGMSTYGPIPGGSVLYFEVELLEVMKAE